MGIAAGMRYMCRRMVRRVGCGRKHGRDALAASMRVTSRVREVLLAVTGCSRTPLSAGNAPIPKPPNLGPRRKDLWCQTPQNGSRKRPYYDPVDPPTRGGGRESLIQEPPNLRHLGPTSSGLVIRVQPDQEIERYDQSSSSTIMRSTYSP